MATYQPTEKSFYLSTAIASGGTTTPEIDLGSFNLCGLYMPSAFTGTAITFQMALTNGGTYVAMTDDTGSAISATVAASKYVSLDKLDFLGVRYLKLVADSQGADRTIQLVCRGLE